MKKLLLALFILTAIGANAQDSAQINDSIANVVDVRASFSGGYTKLKEYLSQNLHYPAGSQTGTVYVELLVKADGKIAQTRIQQGIDNCDDCSAEALRVVSAMPKWKPAIYAGKNVDSYVYLPVRFEAK